MPVKRPTPDIWEMTGQETVVNDIGRRRRGWLGQKAEEAHDDRARQKRAEIQMVIEEAHSHR